MKGDAVVADCKQTAGFRYIKSDTLVHDCILTRSHILNSLLLKTVGDGIDREKNLGCAPVVTILGCLEQSTPSTDMLVDRIGKIVHVELTVPIGHHRLMIVGPAVIVWRIEVIATVGTHCLNIMHTYCRRKSSVVAVGIRKLCACIMYAFLSCESEGCQTGG